MSATPDAPDLRSTAPYEAYAYAYPHKTAYRRLDPPVPLEDAWRDEPTRALFLYVHVPFCAWRCGFCNLFTRSRPQGDVGAPYVAALERQAARVARALPGARFVRLALGGGTPTHLDVADLRRVLDLAARLGAPPGEVPTSVETSPESATPDKLALLRERGVTRVSVGVQTFDEAEARAVSRPQRTADVEAALDRLRAAAFPTLNVDLIYGLPGQTPASWLASLERALRWAPEELFLYPLYVRPLTGLGLGERAPRDDGQDRLELYRLGRDLLRARGWEQVSMRLFRRPGAPQVDGPAYCCQDDGMLGLGAGARSYTRALHASTEWAVSQRGVQGIIDEFVARDEAAHGLVTHGYRLDDDDQRRRFVIQSLLQRAGLDRGAYRARFGGDALEHLPALRQLLAPGWATLDDARLALTDEGLARSDAIGPWLYSPRVRALMATYEVL